MAIPHRTNRLFETRLNKKNPQRVAEGLVRVHLLFLIPLWFDLDPEEIRTDRLVETKLNKKNPQPIAEEGVRVHLLFLNP
ncbi:hypothetical protein BJP37_04745 [Moorena bouillonii PNG]|uniref:Uncharacterized protein n=1 Tax=Moorena bouillonii PNG TaxID=568701 RepID=A0A1U7MXM4_9CYAN|nr:hypothetical protein BJP37_04745 [Moorena bouillonii PNG]